MPNWGLVKKALGSGAFGAIMVASVGTAAIPQLALPAGPILCPKGSAAKVGRDVSHSSSSSSSETSINLAFECEFDKGDKEAEPIGQVVVILTLFGIYLLPCLAIAFGVFVALDKKAKEKEKKKEKKKQAKKDKKAKKDQDG